MADIDIDPFEKPDVTDDRTDETFPLLPTRSGGDQIDRSRIDETSFGGSQNVRVLELFVDELYQKLANDIEQTPQAKFIDLFETRDGEFYYKGNGKITDDQRKTKDCWTIEKNLG